MGYVISYVDGDPVAIQHVDCGFRTHNPTDIARCYCGHCHRFLDSTFALNLTAEIVLLIAGVSVVPQSIVILADLTESILRFCGW